LKPQAFWYSEAMETSPCDWSFPEA